MTELNAESRANSLHQTAFVIAAVTVMIPVAVLSSTTQLITASQNFYLQLGATAMLLLAGFAVCKGPFGKVAFALAFLFAGAVTRVVMHIVGFVALNPVETLLLVAAQLPLLGLMYVATRDDRPSRSWSRRALAVGSLAAAWLVQALLVPYAMREPLRGNGVELLDLADGDILLSPSGDSLLVGSITTDQCEIRLKDEEPARVQLDGFANPRFAFGSGISDSSVVLAVGEAVEGGKWELRFVKWKPSGEETLGRTELAAEALPSNGCNIVSPTLEYAALDGGRVIALETMATRQLVPDNTLDDALFAAWSRDAKTCVYFDRGSNAVLLVDVSSGDVATHELHYPPYRVDSFALSPDKNAVAYVTGAFDTIVFQRLPDGERGTVRLGGALRLRTGRNLFWTDSDTVVFITWRSGLYELNIDFEKRRNRLARVSQLLDAVVGCDYAAADGMLYWTTAVDGGTVLHRKVMGS